MKTEWNPALARKARRMVAEYLEVRLLTQRAFGAMLGVHINSIQSWETGRRVPENSQQFIFLKVIENPSVIDDVRRMIGDG